MRIRIVRKLGQKAPETNWQLRKLPLIGKPNFCGAGQIRKIAERQWKLGKTNDKELVGKTGKTGNIKTTHDDITHQKWMMARRADDRGEGNINYFNKLVFYSVCY